MARAPIRLPRAAGAWQTPEFEYALKHELEGLDARDLPLQSGLALGSRVGDEGFRVMVLGAGKHEGRIRARVGIFYTGIIAGCSCADDPTPVEGHTEYCQVQIDIDPATGECATSLLPE